MLKDGQSTEPEKTEAPTFARGRPAEHPYGVLYQGEWETESDGNAFAVRKHARALADAGLPVLLKSFSNVVVTDGIPETVPTVGLPERVRQEVRGLHRTSVSRFTPMIKHMVIANAERLSRTLMRGLIGPADRAELVIGAQQAAYQATIIYSVWERSFISQDVARHLALMAENWVPCEHNAELLRNAGVERVRVVPHPYDPEDDICKLVRRVPDTHGWRLFYSIGKWEPRKGYANLIVAFLKTFKPEDKVVLTIKYSGGQWRDYPSPEEAVTLALSLPSVQANGWSPEKLDGRLVLLGKRLSRSRIVEVHYRNNIYVNSSHGEGWCLPAFEAKLAGNALVHVAYGGTADFAHIRDRRVPYRMGPVHASYGWEPGAEWADYDIDQLGEALKAAEPPERFQAPDGYERFTAQAVGQQMRGYVMNQARRLDTAAAEYYEGCPNVRLVLKLEQISAITAPRFEVAGRLVAAVLDPRDGVQIVDSAAVRHGGFQVGGSVRRPTLRILADTEVELFDVPRQIAEKVVSERAPGVASAEMIGA